MSSVGEVTAPTPTPVKLIIMSLSNVAQIFRSSLLPASIVLLWLAAAKLAWVPKALLPQPEEVIARIWYLSATGELIRHVWASIARLVEGIILGGIPAIALGILVGMYRVFEDLMAPTLRFLTPVPVLAWMPLVILFLGVDEAAKVALLAIGVFFIPVLATDSTHIPAICRRDKKKELH